jgi:hypothetical protein
MEENKLLEDAKDAVLREGLRAIHAWEAAKWSGYRGDLVHAADSADEKVRQAWEHFALVAR